MREIRSDALFILLVEKDAAFMRLAEDRFYNTYPCIILTAKGQPDVATRCLLLVADQPGYPACRLASNLQWQLRQGQTMYALGWLRSL